MSFAASPDAAKVATQGYRRLNQVLDVAWGIKLSVIITPHVRFASLSRRLVRCNFLDLRREQVFGRFKIEARLNVHPERTAGLEELAEPQRGVGRDGLFFACDAFNSGTRHVQRGRDRVGCQLSGTRNSSRKISPG
jgi:hypothetical protein